MGDIGGDLDDPLGVKGDIGGVLDNPPGVPPGISALATGLFVTYEQP